MLTAISVCLGPLRCFGPVVLQLWVTDGQEYWHEAPLDGVALRSRVQVVQFVRVGMQVKGLGGHADVDNHFVVLLTHQIGR